MHALDEEVSYAKSYCKRGFILVPEELSSKQMHGTNSQPSPIKESRDDDETGM